VTKILLVGVGGFLGSVARYLLGGYAQQLSGGASFPYGTLAVNVLGCFVIGFLAELAEARGVFSPESRALVFVGLLGGFTTFSAFGNETVNLLRDGQTPLALANVAAHIVIGLGAVWLGRAAAQQLFA
jgi:fluoride exporter